VKNKAHLQQQQRHSATINHVCTFNDSRSSLHWFNGPGRRQTSPSAQLPRPHKRCGSQPLNTVTRFFGFKGTRDQLLFGGGIQTTQRINVFQFHFSLGQAF